LDVSLFPNWVGTSQERLYKFEGDILDLSTRQDAEEIHFSSETPEGQPSGVTGESPVT